MSVHGFKIRPGRAEMLPPLLERLGFHVRAFDTSPEGPCDRFELSAQALEVPKTQEGPPLATVLALFSGDPSLCQTARSFESRPLMSVVRRGTAGAGLTLRLRDVDLTMVFQGLRALTDCAFIVDGDVSGRVDVDWTDVTLDQALASLAELPDLYVMPPERGALTGSPVSPRFRVSTTGRPWSRLSPSGWEAHPLPVEVVRGDVADFLRLVSDLTGLALAVPDGPLGEATVLGADLAVDELFANVLDGAGLRLHLETARLERDPSRAVRASVVVPQHPTALGWRLRARDEQYARCRCLPVAESALDVELAGVGRLGNGPWKPLHFSTRGVEPLPGDTNPLDYEVEDVDGNGVTLRTQTGLRLRLNVPPLQAPDAPRARSSAPSTRP